VRLTVTAKVGGPFSVTASADGVRAEAKSEYICPQAEKRPLTKETLEKQMERMGTTAYALDVLETDIGDGVMVPMSVMNETRREALSRLDEARLSKIAARRAEIAARFSVSEEKAKKDVYRKKKDSLPKLTVHADTPEKARAAVEAGAEVVLYGGDAYDHHLVTPEEYKEVWEFTRAEGRGVSLATPRILRKRFLPSLAPLLRTLSDAPADDVYVHHLGALRIVREYTELPVVSDFSLLAYNALAVRELADLGFSRATLSPELNFPQIETLTQKSVLPVECIVHGRLELMVSAYCAPGSFLGDVGSGACSAPCVKGKYFLKDRTGALFPVVTDAGCQMHILNAKVLSMLPQAGRFARLGAERIRIDGRYMTAREIGEIVRGYREFLYYDEELSEAQKERARRIEGGDVTRGHYFRGVL
jgi:putative protease